MDLAFITPSFYPATYYGGPIYSTYELAKAFAKNNTHVSVVTTNANGNERLNVKTGVYQKLDKNLPVKYYNSLDSKGTSLSMFFNLWKDIQSTDLIYLISIFSPSTPLTIILCRLFNKQVIISPRGQLGKWCLNQGNKFKKLWLHAFIQPFIPRLYWHLTSEEEQKDVLAVYPFAKTFVIQNGIDIDKYKNNNYKKDKLFYKKYSNSVNENSKIIISMGRLQKVKGFDILIEAMKKVQELAPSAFGGLFRGLILFIAGEDFGEKDNLLKQIKEFNMADSVFLVGHIEGAEKINFLKNAVVFALPSYAENFGMVYAEALAAGTPIVASTNTPWQDVEKYNCGKWVENTPSQFANAIIKILNSDPVQMGQHGRKYVEEHFSWDKIASNFKKRIEEIISERKIN